MSGGLGGGGKGGGERGGGGGGEKAVARYLPRSSRSMTQLVSFWHGKMSSRPAAVPTQTWKVATGSVGS